jgi:hypothetical protein
MDPDDEAARRRIAWYDRRDGTSARSALAATGLRP